MSTWDLPVIRPKATHAVINPADNRDLMTHVGEGVSVDVRRRLDDDPMVRITWFCDPAFSGFHVKGFKNDAGFGPDDYTTNFKAHGQMVFESLQPSGVFEEHVRPASYYYTMLLYKRGWFGFSEKLTQPLRFRVEIPSKQTKIGSIQERTELADTEHADGLRQLQRRDELNRAMLSLLDSEAAVRDRRAAAEGKKAQSAEDVLSDHIERVKQTVRTSVGAQQAMAEILASLETSDAFRAMSKAQKSRLRRFIEGQFGSLNIEEKAFRES